MAESIVNRTSIQEYITLLRDVVRYIDNHQKSLGYANTFLGCFGLSNDVGSIISAMSAGISFGSFFNDLEYNCDDIIDQLEEYKNILQDHAEYDLLKLRLETTEIDYFESIGGPIKTAIIPTEVTLIAVHTSGGWIAAR